MRILYRITFFLLIIATQWSFISIHTAEAQRAGSGNFGIGIMVGEPTGIAPKLWLNQESAIAGGIAWAFSGEASMHLHADFINHVHGLVDVEGGMLSFYYGMGGRLLLRENSSKIGMRFPIGLNYILSGSSIEFFLEIVPVFNLLPSTDFSGNGGIGFRYYF